MTTPKTDEEVQKLAARISQKIYDRRGATGINKDYYEFTEVEKIVVEILGSFFTQAKSAAQEEIHMLRRNNMELRVALQAKSTAAPSVGSSETQNAPLPCPWCNHGAIESKLLGRHVKCPQRGCAGNAGWFRYKAWNKRAPSVGGAAMPLGVTEPDLSTEDASKQKGTVGGIIIPQGPPPELKEAAVEALIVIAAWNISDDESPYREVGEGMRNGFRKAHDLLMDAIPGGIGMVKVATERWQARSVSTAPESEAGSGNPRQEAAATEEAEHAPDCDCFYC